MKKLLFIALFLTAFSASYAQQENPVHWHISHTKQMGNKYQFHFKALINPPYHIYAQKNTSDVALPTTIHFRLNPEFELQGTPTENGTLETKKDQTSGTVINYYSQEVDFVQLFTLKHKGKTIIKGYISYMACTDDHCLPEAKKNFSITITK